MTVKFANSPFSIPGTATTQALPVVKQAEEYRDNPERNKLYSVRIEEFQGCKISNNLLELFRREGLDNAGNVLDSERYIKFCMKHFRFSSKDKESFKELYDVLEELATQR